MHDSLSRPTTPTSPSFSRRFQYRPSHRLRPAARLSSAILAIGLMLALCEGVSAQNDTNTQNWEGVLDLGAAKLTLKIEINQDGAKSEHSASLTVVEQGNSKIPVDHVEIDEKTMTLKLDSLNASFKGTFDPSGNVCNGKFSQHGHEFDLKLDRVEATEDDAGELIEYWKGTLDHSGTELEMGLKVFQMADGSLTAKLDSYSQGVTDLPVEFEKEDDQYVVRFPAARLEYRGTLDESKQKLVGTIKQAGTANELVFAKADFNDTPKYNRPQTPQEPFPYVVQDVVYENSKQEAKLAGTLTIPEGDGPFPVAIIISGSGGTDRNGSNFEHKPYMVIADHLARNHVAVLRFDDRGIGESTGDYTSATSADFATDVEAGIDFLKQQPKIDAGKIGLIGHSEGGLIAPMVAAERDDVHFIVLLAGTGIDGGAILKSQSTAMMKASGESEERLEANRKLHDAVLSLLRSNPNATHEELKAKSTEFVESINDEKTREFTDSTAKQLTAMLRSKWVKFFVLHDPVKTLGNVNCHVLAMNGEKDLQVLCDLNLTPIEKALKGGTPASFEIVRLPDANHMFQETEGSGSPADYGKIEQTVSPKALSTISDWVRKVTR